MNAKQLFQKGNWNQVALSVILGLILGAYLLGLSAADLPADWFALLVLASILPFIAVVTRDIKKFLITLIVLDMSLSLDVKLFQPPIHASVDGLFISLTTISLTILYLIWITGLLTGNSRIRFYKSVSLPALFLLIAGIISTFNAKDPTLSAFELALYVELFLVFFYLANHLRVPDDFRFFTNVLLVGFLIVALSVIAMQLLGSFRFMGLGSETLDIGSERFVRSGGLHGPNVAATYLMSLSMVALAALLTKAKIDFGRLLALVALPLGFLALILTFSRSGLISLATAGLVFSLLALRRKWLRWQHVVLLIAVLGLLLFLFRVPIIHRAFIDDQGSAASRMPLNIIAINMIKTHPWIGVGINNFMVVVQDYHTPETVGAWLAPVHNKYLLVWSETGIIGILSFLLFNLAIISAAWKGWKRGDPLLSPLALALLAAMVGRMVHMGVARFDGRTPGLLLWITAGIVTAMSNIESDG